MKNKTILAVALSIPVLSWADSTEDQLRKMDQQINALKNKIEALEKQSADSAALANSDSDDAPAKITQGELDKLKQRVANQQLKVNALNDAANSGPISGLSVTGYIDPIFVANRNQHTRGVQFLNGGDNFGYDGSAIGDVYLEIKKTFGVGSMAPFIDLQIMPNRGYGSFTVNSGGNYTGNIFSTALANIPLTDHTTFTAGYTPSFAGYEYQQSNLTLTMTHGLLYDWSEPGTYMGAGINYWTGNWAYKTFIGNEEYRSAQAVSYGEANHNPTFTGRFDYTWTSTLYLGGSFSYGKNTLPYPDVCPNDSEGNPLEGYGYQCANKSAYGQKFYAEMDLTYVNTDTQWNAQLDYGSMEHAAWNGGFAQWYGASLLAHTKWTGKTLGRMGITGRIDYLNDETNGGGGGGTYFGSGTDGYNGFGIAPECLANSSHNGKDCNGGNHISLTATWLLYPTDQITLKTEARYDMSSEKLFSDSNGQSNRSNMIYGLQFVYVY